MKLKLFTFAVAVSVFIVFGDHDANAWDYEGHHTVNELALASLPPEFGGFELTPALKSRIEYLAGEPDRWRNIRRFAAQDVNGPDHYFDPGGFVALWTHAGNIADDAL